MQVDKETLIKHRFWILLGVAVPLILIAYLLMITAVSGSIKAERQKVEDSLKALKGISNPKNNKHLTQLQERGEKVGGKQNEVWAKAYKLQDGLMTWPDDIKQFNKLYFGDPINTSDLGDYADRFYKNQFWDIYSMPQPKNEMNEPLVQYLGSWDSVIRLIPPPWPKSPPSASEAWMAQEDLWVQRELLRVIRETNQSYAVFRDVTELQAIEKEKLTAAKDKPASEAAKDKPAPEKPAADKEPTAAEKDKASAEQKPAATIAKPAPKTDPRHRQFQNPTWDLELMLAKNENNKTVIRGTIKNRTSKRQTLVGIYFKVRVQDDPKSRPAPLLIDREPLAAGESAPLKESLPIDNLDPQGIFGVEQILSWRTAPVKRIDQLELFYPSHRISAWTMVPPTFAKEPDAPADPTAGGTVGTEPSGVGTGSPDGMGGPGGRGMPGMSGMGGMGQGTQTDNGLEKNRYVDLTDQVRRMPVGIVVIVDQAHVQDFLTAVANSRLRIQTTQVHWTHFRGSIKPPELGGTPDGSGGFGDPGDTGSPDGGGVSTPRGAMGGRGGRGSPDGLAGGPGAMGGRPSAPGAMGAMGMQRGGRSSGMMAPPSMPGSMGGMMMGGPGYGFPGGAAGMMTSAENQEDDPNLVELAVYGIASLYQKFPPKPPAPDAPATPDGGTTPAPATP